MSKRRSAVLLMGPTGSGKTEAAVGLAEQLPLEIISVDSALVYRGMDIGTAKPSSSVRARIPHHLIDIRDPAQGYSVGEFTLDVQRAMQDIWSRGRQPLLVGGTMMYFHALTAGIADLPEAAGQEADFAADGGEVWALVRELPPKQRAAVTLRFAADLPHAEIAEALGCTPAAARRSLHEGIKRLREELR